MDSNSSEIHLASFDEAFLQRVLQLRKNKAELKLYQSTDQSGVREFVSLQNPKLKQLFMINQAKALAVAGKPAEKRPTDKYEQIKAQVLHDDLTVYEDLLRKAYRTKTTLRGIVRSKLEVSRIALQDTLQTVASNNAEHVRDILGRTFSKHPASVDEFLEFYKGTIKNIFIKKYQILLRQYPSLKCDLQPTIRFNLAFEELEHGSQELKKYLYKSLKDWSR